MRSQAGSTTARASTPRTLRSTSATSSSVAKASVAKASGTTARTRQPQAKQAPTNDVEVDKSSFRKAATSGKVQQSRASNNTEATRPRATIAVTTGGSDVPDPNGTGVCVAVRIRPLLVRESDDSDGVVVSSTGQTVSLVDARGEERPFEVDVVFDSRENAKTGCAKQESVFEGLGREFVLASLGGLNVCIFAYGQTGSGKTYTMQGDIGQKLPSACQGVRGGGPGLLPQMLKEVFDSHRRAKVVARYTVKYYEIYNETIIDLLLPPPEFVEMNPSLMKKPEVHFHSRFGVTVSNLCEEIVEHEEAALELLRFGNRMRSVAATALNGRSSRSHAIYELHFEHDQNSEYRESSIIVVDLAGRENENATLNMAERFKEQVFINLALFHLTSCIQNLSKTRAEQWWHPFRNTKLTMVLSHALAGNSKSALMATISPSAMYFEDSLATLRFAQGVRRLKTQPSVNCRTAKTKAEELQAEIERLRKQMQSDMVGKNQLQQDLIETQALAEHYMQSWQEIQKKSVENKRRRTTASAELGLIAVESGVASNKDSPCLVNLSDDPGLQACCVYFINLNGPGLRVGGDAEWSTMLLHGVGICPRMCTITHSISSGIQSADGPIVTLSVESPQSVEGMPAMLVPRVLVNGSRPVENQELRHDDRLIFGYDNAFRLVFPAELRSHILSREAAAALLDVDSALKEVQDANSEQFQKLRPFLTHFLQHSDEHAVRKLLRVLHRVCPLVDEANLIADEIRPDDGLSLQLQVLSDLFDFENDLPELMVCVMQKPKGHNCNESSRGRFRSSITSLFPDSVMDEDAEWMSSNERRTSLMSRLWDSSLLNVWPLEKFMQRLQAMRDLYQESARLRNYDEIRQNLESKPHTDPWRETNFFDVQNMALGLLSQNAPSDPRGDQDFRKSVFDAQTPDAVPVNVEEARRAQEPKFLQGGSEFVDNSSGSKSDFEKELAQIQEELQAERAQRLAMEANVAQFKELQRKYENLQTVVLEGLNGPPPTGTQSFKPVVSATLADAICTGSDAAGTGLDAVINGQDPSCPPQPQGIAGVSRIVGKQDQSQTSPQRLPQKLAQQVVPLQVCRTASSQPSQDGKGEEGDEQLRQLKELQEQKQKLEQQVQYCLQQQQRSQSEAVTFQSEESQQQSTPQQLIATKEWPAVQWQPSVQTPFQSVSAITEYQSPGELNELSHLEIRETSPPRVEVAPLQQPLRIVRQESPAPGLRIVSLSDEVFKRRVVVTSPRAPTDKAVVQSGMVRSLSQTPPPPQPPCMFDANATTIVRCASGPNTGHISPSATPRGRSGYMSPIPAPSTTPPRDRSGYMSPIPPSSQMQPGIAAGGPCLLVRDGLLQEAVSPRSLTPPRSRSVSPPPVPPPKVEGGGTLHFLGAQRFVTPNMTHMVSEYQQWRCVTPQRNLSNKSAPVLPNQVHASSVPAKLSVPQGLTLPNFGAATEDLSLKLLQLSAVPRDLSPRPSVSSTVVTERPRDLSPRSRRATSSTVQTRASIISTEPPCDLSPRMSRTSALVSEPTRALSPRMSRDLSPLPSPLTLRIAQ